jgi:hypothetical protein
MIPIAVSTFSSSVPIMTVTFLLRRKPPDDAILVIEQPDFINFIMISCA